MKEKRIPITAAVVNTGCGIPRKRVLVIGNSELSVFGFRRELIERLVAVGCEVFACFPKTRFGDGWETAKRLNCVYIPIEIDSRGMNPVVDILLLKRFCTLISQIGPDVVLTYTVKPNVYGGLAAMASRTPYIMNVTGLGTAKEHPGLLQKIVLTLYKLSALKAQKVFFQNSEDESLFARGHIADGKRKVIAGSGVYLSRFAVMPYPPEKGEIHFLFLGRIMREKGIEQYLEAARIVQNRHPETVFHVIGMCTEVQYEPVLKEMVADGLIQYHGHQTDIREFLGISSCTIHPTYYAEGMSNVLLESAASGRPIITTDRSGCREIVEDGVNGFICRQKDVDDLVLQIERFLALSWEERRDMGLAGRAKVERHFDRQKVVDEYLFEIMSQSEAVVGYLMKPESRYI